MGHTNSIFFLAFCTVHNDKSLYQEKDLSSHTVIPRVKRMARKKKISS